MNHDEQDLVRRRQKSRAMIMGWILGALVMLTFAFSIVKIRSGM